MTASRPSSAWSNWAGNQRVHAVRALRPTNEQGISDAIRAAVTDGLTVKPIGAGHSFTGAAVTEGVRLDLTELSGFISIDRERKQITVQAGMKLRTLNEILATNGMAMPNLGDIDVQTISGAFSTGTHGTGALLGCLSTFVVGLRIVTGSGETIVATATENPDVFQAARVGVGALGVITEVTLQVTDAFTLQADERPAQVKDIFGSLDQHVADNEHFEMYWFPYTDLLQVKRNNRVPSSDRPLTPFKGWLDDDFLPNTVFGAACRLGRLVPPMVPAVSKLAARALSARVYTDRSDRVFCTPRRVRFTEMEYGLPRAALPEAFAALRKIVDSMPFKIAFPVEMRFSAPDDIWLSHGYGRENSYIAIHQYAGMPYQPYMQAFEKVAIELGGRPHWGKLNWRDAESLRTVYPKFDDFLAVRNRLDPGRVFANAYTSRIFGA
jgi:L-gulono-1,4-lactone dehydrogenase